MGCEMNKMLNKVFLKNRQGFTLVEVIVSMALVSIILLMASSLLTTGQKMYNKGTDKADIQFDARMAADFITNELRNATNIGFGTRLDDSYSWIGLADQSVRYLAAGSPLETNKTGAYITSLEVIGIESATTADGRTRQILKFAIRADDHTEIETKVLLNNNMTSLIGTTVPALMNIYYRKPAAGNDVNSVADRMGGVELDFINNTFNDPSVPAGYTVEFTGTSNSTFIRMDRTVIFPATGDTTVTLTFKISKGSESTTRDVVVNVPRLTPKVIADNIDRIPVIAAGDTSLSLPDVPGGFDLVIKTSSNEAVINSTTGAITMQDESTTVDIVIMVTKADFPSGDSRVIKVHVPAKNDALTGISYNVAGRTITGTTALMEYSLGGTVTSPSLTWMTAGEGTTSNVDFVPGAVWIRQIDDPSSIQMLGNIAAPAPAPMVSLKRISGNTYKFVNSGDGSGDRLEGGKYEYSLDNVSWQDIGAEETIDKPDDKNISVRLKAKEYTLPSQAATNIPSFK